MISLLQLMICLKNSGTPFSLLAPIFQIDYYYSRHHPGPVLQSGTLGIDVSVPPTQHALENTNFSIGFVFLAHSESDFVSNLFPEKQQAVSALRSVMKSM